MLNMFAKVRIRTFVFFGGIFSFVAACNPPAHTLYEAAHQEVFTTATCSEVEVSHVSASDVPEAREDVYAAEGCGMRWRMACNSERVKRCKRHSSSCTNKLEYTCSDIQTENPNVSDHELRTRVTRPDEMNILGS